MNHLRNIGTAILALMIIGMLCACTGAMQLVKVPLPVACQEAEPTRPVMPTEALKAAGCQLDKCLDSYVQAAQAEIERREGYEGKLRTALQACIKPIAGV